MRKILVLFSALLLLGHQNTFAEVRNKKPSIFSARNGVSENFPFGTPGQLQIIPKNNGKIQICSVGEVTCEEFRLPDQVQLATSHIFGPFIGPSHPSWLAINKNLRYLCVAKENNILAECVQLGKHKNSDIEITVRYRGVIPELVLSSSSSSQEYVEKYAKEFANFLNSAAKLLKSNTTSDTGFTTMSEDMPIVEVTGELPPPDIGGGGIAVVPIGDGSWGSDPTAGGGGGGDGSGGCEVSNSGSSNGGSCPTVEDLLKRCIKAADYNYYERYIPACQRIYAGNSSMLAQCYADAADQYADDLKFCRDTYK